MSSLENKKFDIFMKNFRTQISKLGFKNTIQKDYILKILFFSKKHLSAEEITKEIQKEFNLDIGIATVYRGLSFFEQMGIINSLDIGDGIKRFEFKVDKTHHDHLVCIKCNKIIEFNDDFIELNQIKIAEKNGFILKDHIMTIYGICTECDKN
ncbi:Fur family transcriptional regulator [Halarcobacter anaerophilus]|jgi:Fur family ferric uptake transcriptional regulator|uniref:Ferric uptake regulation protein n=1 Tax=Halarcobacter anaerophilus TaxID=877500 RepID=A0A4Q0Y3L8_9BACT|nr:transcriptional repressor [Halarcobacter anaerophilus]QDF27752.1 transcriptional regulator, Fur family [Halarcobacter anaerophilus]RXJ64095.1 transcriptional repressor [Halarcobacter anaerophilus]